MFLPTGLVFMCLLPTVVPATASKCSASNTCITMSACAERHAGNKIMGIPFPCTRDKVCCPPVKQPQPTQPPTPYNPTCCPPSNPKPPQPADRPSLPEPDDTEPDRPLKRISDHRNYHLLPQPPYDCGVQGSNDKVTEGEVAIPGQFPWMALIGIRGDDGRLNWGCGGSLINNRYVLTAAHCVKSNGRFISTVRLREHTLDSEVDCHASICVREPPVDIDIERIISHPEWNNTHNLTLKNDIALLRLTRVVTESKIIPICLPLAPENLSKKAEPKYEIAGWGTTDPDIKAINPVLMRAIIAGKSLQDCNVCKLSRPNYCPITKNQICAQGSRGVDVCKGDSGSPLMTTDFLNTFQVGITSFKTITKCGEDGIPSIFTNVSAYLRWIMDNVRE